MPFYVSVGPRGILFCAGMISTALMGSLSYWWTNLHRPAIAVPPLLPEADPDGRALDDFSEPHSRHRESSDSEAGSSRLTPTRAASPEFSRGEFLAYREAQEGDQ